MPRHLEVECFDRRAGELVDDGAQLTFTYDREWIDAGLPPLSQSLPLDVALEPLVVQAFFDGLLPEGGVRRTLATTLSVSRGNTFSLLEEIGGDTAGAISIFPPERRPAPGAGWVEWLDDRALAELVQELPRRPMHAGGDGRFRLSLAGAQDKLPVVVKDGRVGLTDGVRPSTHILKLPLAGLPASVLNEALWASVGRHLDIASTTSFPHRVGDVEMLLVARYDRRTSDGHTTRLHQEDFCQALGVDSEHKYETEGGPGLADCFALARRASTVPAVSLLRLLDSWALSFIAGNHDAHGKNFSLLYHPDRTDLAPAYDILSSWVYDSVRPMDRKMAMKVGGENRPAYVRRRHLERMLASAGLGSAPARRRLRAIATRAPAAIDAAAAKLQETYWADPFVDRIVALGHERARRLVEIIDEPL